MKRVYFDRNVFADIADLRRGLTTDDVILIQAAVSTRTISIPLSITLFEETVALIKNSDSEYQRQFRTVLSLIDANFIVKPANTILIDDCWNYAERKPFQRLEPLSPDLRHLLNVSLNRAELLELAEKSLQHFKRSAEKITASLLDAHSDAQERNVSFPKDFTDVWNEESLAMAERRLEGVPRNIRRLCKKRGIGGLLKIRSIHLYTIYYSWIVYSSLYGVQGNPRGLRESDLADWSHAVQASACDIFVTQESPSKLHKLPNILSRVPVDGFRVLSLAEFLAFLRS